MTRRSLSRHPVAASAALLFVGVLVHRGVVLGTHLEALRALVAANPDWLLEQYLPIELLRERPVEALVHLQQSPPIPNFVLAVLLRLAAWPGGIAVALIVLQAVVAAATTALLAALVGRSTRWWIGALLGACFALDPDLLLLEYTAFGQHLYESLTAFWVLAAAGCFWRSVETGDRPWTVGLGVFVALAALTRASYSLLFVPVTAAVALAHRTERRRHLLAVVLPIALLHGGWAAKQWIVFGEPRITTSTWGGGNLVFGLEEAGLGDELIAFLHEHAERYPAWFVELHATGLTSQWFNDPAYLAHVPPEWREADRRIARHLAPEDHDTLDNAVANTVSKARLYALYGELWREFALAHPLTILDRTRRSYEVYWLPIRYHARQFLGLFSCEWRTSPRAMPWQLAAAWARGELPEPIELVSGSHPDLDRRVVRLPVASTASLVAWQIQLWCVHLLLPIALVISWRRYRLRPPPVVATLYFLVAVYVYSAGLHNLVEYGENMRFRSTVAPLTWWLATLVITRLADGADPHMWRRDSR